MNITNLSPVAIQLNIDLKICSDAELKKIIYTLQFSPIIVIKKQNLTIERINYINHIWGTHQLAHIWCNHLEYPIIFRVTNREIEPGKKGLFGDGELDWHSNGVFAPDPEEIVSLYCVKTHANSVTYWTDFAKAYSDLPEAIKIEIENIDVHITNKISDLYLKRAAHYPLLEHEQQALDKISTRTRNFSGGNPDNPFEIPSTYFQTDSKSNSVRKLKERTKPLVVMNKISKKKGLYFPFLSIDRLLHVDEQRSEELFYYLVEHCIKSENYTYGHIWEEGDLILADQRVGLHRRNNIIGERELYRTAFWPHKDDVEHWINSLHRSQ